MLGKKVLKLGLILVFGLVSFAYGYVSGFEEAYTLQPQGMYFDDDE